MVFIPTGLKYTTQLTGRVPRLVQCQSCGFEYVYLLESTVTGEGTSPLFLDNEGASQRSKADAEAALQQQLASGVEVVPCPRCGHIHESMIPRARELHLDWMFMYAVYVLIGAGALAAPAGILSEKDLKAEGLTVLSIALCALDVMLFATAAAMFIIRAKKCASYDPNEMPVEERKRLGNDLAVSKEEYLKIVSP
jgi:hypothetical protein